ncbi:alpha/beta fold hydrolase [Sulfitobacter sp. S190]|uniref:alpha/beta fold hydrolase n=1 Tax=Sulfitobacter sp. S190 TaxID=2867022 RepID=UPI0021A66187|nr:alpha/beta hydrolase [Sulfitobacter sp. S190]UWR22290.1 alpha/beta hydrolase [Sulfitobacter sp. S190]
MITALVSLALVLAIVIWPFYRERLRPEMDDSLRGRAVGQFAELPAGTTHFQFLGPENGPLVVCVHGLTTPSFMWHAIAKSLADAGARVLIYDLYGRGYSARPEGAQTTAFFVTQLTHLLDHVNARQHMTLLGYSMGARIAANFAAQHPDRTDAIVMVAPALSGIVENRFLETVRRWRFFGRWLMLADYPRRFRSQMRRDAAAPQAIVDQQIAQLDTKGYLPAIRSSLRHALRHSAQGDIRRIARAGIPTLAIWAEDDAVIPRTTIGDLTEWYRDAQHTVVKGAGHGLPYTHPNAVADAIIGQLD